jgi:uncharacterized protein
LNGTRKKADANYRKHKIRFEEAQTVFLDRRAVEFFDENHSDAEARFLRVGLSLRLNVLVVIYCERSGNKIRIIFARKATPRERRVYEERV